MTDREKLIEILTDLEKEDEFICDGCVRANKSICIESLANRLITNGVTVKKMEKLNPCKKCGGKGMVFTVFSQNADPLYYYCRCQECGFETTPWTDKAKAKINWNRGEGVDE